MGVNIKNTLNTLNNWETKIKQNKVTKFAYTQEAYDNINYVDGVEDFDVNAENNIPVSAPDVIKINETIVSKGFRSKASSLTRMLMNHMFGRVSYNLNKIHDNFQTLLTVLQQGFHPVYFATNSQVKTDFARSMTFDIDCPNLVLEEGARIFITFTQSVLVNARTVLYLKFNGTNMEMIKGGKWANHTRPWVAGETVEFLYTSGEMQILKSIYTAIDDGVLYLGV